MTPTMPRASLAIARLSPAQLRLLESLTEPRILTARERRSGIVLEELRLIEPAGVARLAMQATRRALVALLLREREAHADARVRVAELRDALLNPSPFARSA